MKMRNAKDSLPNRLRDRTGKSVKGRKSWQSLRRSLNGWEMRFETLNERPDASRDGWRILKGCVRNTRRMSRILRSLSGVRRRPRSLRRDRSCARTSRRSLRRG